MSDQQIYNLTDGEMLKTKWQLEENISFINLNIAKSKSRGVTSSTLSDLIDDRKMVEINLNKIEKELSKRLLTK